MILLQKITDDEMIDPRIIFGEGRWDFIQKMLHTVTERDGSTFDIRMEDSEMEIDGIQLKLARMEVEKTALTGKKKRKVLKTRGFSDKQMGKILFRRLMGLLNGSLS